MNNINYLLISCIVIFFAKLKTIQKFNTSQLDINNSFFFLFDERNMAQEYRTFLKNYSANYLFNNNILMIKTNILFYNISAREESLGCIEYLLLLYYIYIVIKMHEFL